MYMPIACSLKSVLWQMLKHWVKAPETAWKRLSILFDRNMHRFGPTRGVENDDSRIFNFHRALEELCLEDWSE